MLPQRPSLALSVLGALLASGCSDPGGGGGGERQIDAAAGSSDGDVRFDGAPGTPDATPGAFCDALGSMPSKWISGGPDCGTEPDIQVHQLNADTYILRQSLCTSFEAPFLYLLFGDDKVLLEDTGDGGIDVVGTVNAIVAAREEAIGHELELVVVNSHGHGDHVKGNSAFASDGATVVGTSQSAVQNFFAMDWPHVFKSYDLGNRVIEVAGIPGHQSAHIAIYDQKYGMLLTGDTLYPGRLYISSFAAYKASTAFLASAVTAREVCGVFGTHIEMTTTPGQDYDFSVTHHPNERSLLLDRSHVLELDAAMKAMNSPELEVHDDFIIYPL